MLGHSISLTSHPRSCSYCYLCTCRQYFCPCSQTSIFVVLDMMRKTTLDSRGFDCVSLISFFQQRGPAVFGKSAFLTSFSPHSMVRMSSFRSCSVGVELQFPSWFWCGGSSVFFLFSSYCVTDSAGPPIVSDW